MRTYIVLFFALLTFYGSFGQGCISKQECVVRTYESQVGVREATGNNDGDAVGMYLQSTGLGEGYAWCAAFVNWVYVQCVVQTPLSPAWSPSWFLSKRVIYANGKEIKTPGPGDVFGIYFASKGRIAHVGFIDDWGKDIVMTVEGNTNDAGSRDGDGVYRKRRLKRQVYKVSRWID